MGELLRYEREAYVTYPYDSCMDYMKDSGCYYIIPLLCKDITINAGASGVAMPRAIMKVRHYIYHQKNIIEDVIPVLRNINQDILFYHAGDLAESIVKATKEGKGVEIIIGYPKVLVINVS